MRFADVLTRVVDRILFGPPAPPLREWTPRRYERLVREHAVVDHPPPVTPVDSTWGDECARILQRALPEDGAA